MCLNKKKVERLRAYGVRLSKVTEYFDNLIEMDWVEMPFIMKKAYRDIAKQIVEMCDAKQ